MPGERDPSRGARGSRVYRSPRREEQARRTRARILTAARQEFLASGYAGTTMRAIAAGAGVSLPTVEQTFGTKSGVLLKVIDVAIAGDDEPVAVLDRAPLARAAAAERIEEFVELVTDVLVAAQQRSARLVQVLLEAAGADSSLRGLAQDRLAQRARTAEWITDGMIRRARLRPGLDRAHAVDTVWVLMDPVVFLRLTEDRDWSPGRYRDWFADGVQQLLLVTDVVPSPGVPRETPGT